MTPLIPRMLMVYWAAMSEARKVSQWRLSSDLWLRFGPVKPEQGLTVMGINVREDVGLPPNSVVLS
jgi:hypothetical protein